MKINPFLSQLPNDCAATRKQLFDGDIFLTSPGLASNNLIDSMIADMEQELETVDIRSAHKHWSDEEFFVRIGNLRRHFYLSSEYHQKLRDVVAESGFPEGKIAFDPIRIRVVLPGGHHNPKAAPVYYPHRDTWYAHPQSLIVWWLPLHDLKAEETFVFFPENFDSEVANNSEIFDYSNWVKDGPALKIGWQKSDSGETGGYPGALEQPDLESGIGFACQRASKLIFAGSHYHQTLPQDFDTVRYSLDFRVVHLDDIETKAGAPNSDNRSKGSTFKDYIKPVEFAT